MRRGLLQYNNIYVGITTRLHVWSMEFHWPWNIYLLQVANYTYTCYFPGQELSVRIISNGWLHKGALVCPPCEELCQVKANNKWKCFIYSCHNSSDRKLDVTVSVWEGGGIL
jgi:hypothetical protein